MLPRIQSILQSLTPAEQQVGQLVLNNPRAFTEAPVDQLAAKAKVSQPTIVRFCRTLGYKGLRDFKLNLAASLSEGVPFIHHNVVAQDNTDELLVKVIDNAATAFLKYRQAASRVQLDQAVSAIHKVHVQKKRLEFFGVGNSGIVAQDAQHKFFRLGFHTAAQSDGHMQMMSASLLGRGDCVVVISNSGKTRDLLDACQIARKNGAVSIVITATDSPLARAGDIHLAADHPESYEQFSPMVSRLLHLLIVDVLATAVALRIGSATLQPSLRNMKQNLLRKRYL
ncbi:MAG: SIS domain-containing protein [Cytophagales bacterium]|nr:SIS domain-containing protein [Cytophagales bacterium]